MKKRPSCSPHLLTTAIDNAPGRVRRRLDKDPTVAEQWQWNVDEDVATVIVDDEVTIEFTPTDGTLNELNQCQCNCLLAPKCFHILACLQVMPLADGEIHAQEIDVADTEAGIELNDDMGQVVEHLQSVVSHILIRGAEKTNIVLQGDLLRGLHQARSLGLHRLAAIAKRIHGSLRALQQEHRGFEIAELSADVSELLLLSNRLLTENPSSDDIGTARRRYEDIGNIRAVGLGSEAIVARNGYRGVVSYMMSEDGRVYTLKRILPPDMTTVENAWYQGLDLGDIRADHATLARRGVHIHGATAAADGSLGSGQQVQAVLSSPQDWHADVFTDKFNQNFEEQINNRSELLFIRCTVRGGAGHGVLVDAGVPLILTADARQEILLNNLNIMSQAAGTCIRVIARIIADKPGMLVPIAIGQDQECSDDLVLPKKMAGRCIIACETLQLSWFKRESQATVTQVRITLPSPLEKVKRRLERYVLGGSRTMDQRANQQCLRDIHLLTQWQCKHGADLLNKLLEQSQQTTENIYGQQQHQNTLALSHAWALTFAWLQLMKSHWSEKCWSDRKLLTESMAP